MTKKCDVLVVGGGPAGSSAARSAAMNGAKTIFIDKKEEIGVPVQCAEGIGEYLFPYLPFEIPNEQLIWQMDGMYFQTDDISVERTGDLYKSYSVDRKYFDKWLSKLAIENRAELFANTELIDIQLDKENNAKKAVVKKEEKTFEIKPKVVIAADGSESTVLKILGLYNPKKGDLAEVYSWEMKNLDLYKPRLEQVFTGEFTPSGYAYIFPKSKTTANVGVGGIFPEGKMETYFKEFLEFSHVRKQIKNAEYVVEKSKKAVFNDITDKWIYGNVILAGDTANQNIKPFIEGILPSVICGDIAGKFAIDKIKKKIIDQKTYYDCVKDKIGEHLLISNELLKLINYLYSKKEKKKYLEFFGLITELFNQEDLDETKNMNYSDLKSKLMGLQNEM
ncbi:MAG: NAD(P)/FAD-dependent oxidoreductase [Candidatus Thermoplasmatota archaeon]|nr:NAD(P)/FAD-dependent oxidoreductase [Candidatus Thermoplasmatota archaeon]